MTPIRAAPVLFLLCCASASAAVVKSTAIGCRIEADAKTLDSLRAKGNADGFDALSNTRIGTGDCATFARGTLVTVEGKHPPLLCARLEGGLDCFWLPERTLSLENPAPEEHKTTGNRSIKF